MGTRWDYVWGRLGELYILVPLEKLYNFGFPVEDLGGRPDNFSRMLLEPLLGLPTNSILSAGSALLNSRLTCFRILGSYFKLSAVRKNTPVGGKARPQKIFSSMWKKYRVWYLHDRSHPWLSFDRTQVTIEQARDQLMAFLGYIKPSMQSYSNFCNHKSAVAARNPIFHGLPAVQSLMSRPQSNL